MRRCGKANMRPQHVQELRSAQCSVPVFQFSCSQSKNAVGYCAPRHEDIAREPRWLSAETVSSSSPRMKSARTDVHVSMATATRGNYHGKRFPKPLDANYMPHTQC